MAKRPGIVVTEEMHLFLKERALFMKIPLQVLVDIQLRQYQFKVENDKKEDIKKKNREKKQIKKQ